MSVKLAEGYVYHGREEGVSHRFRYPLFYLYVPTQEEEPLQDLLRRQFRHFLSFNPQDYLKKSQPTLQTGITEFLREECGYQADSVDLLTMPRMWGFAFNPVSFWFARKNGKLDAVLCEVNNTFNERHFYWICPPGGVESLKWYEAKKVFHVSPFFPVEGFYKFRFQMSDEKFHIDINYFSNEQKLRLATWLRGELRPLAEATSFQLIRRYGWMTVLVVLRIHWHALQLWLRRIPFFKKPEPPQKGVTS